MSASFLLADSVAWTQFVRFWSLADSTNRHALAGVLLLGLSCGLLGSFVVLRKMSLLGDSLGHAVLPGVCLGFLVNRSKELHWLFVGALCSALLATWLIGFIRRRSRLKIDTVMGLILSGFFGFGMVLLSRIQRMSYGGSAGLDKFLFGQTAGITLEDLWLMGGATAVIVLCVTLAFKELTITSFDEGFAASLGLPTRSIHYLLMGLMAVAIVISIQAVGVVLLSAVLITPAATAYLLTDRLRLLVVLSAVIGMASGATGACLSFMGNNLPTGPLIVLVLGAIFLLAYLFAPRHGLLTRMFRRWRQSRRTQRENLLKSIYQLFETKHIPVSELIITANTTVAAATARAFPLPVPSQTNNVSVSLSQLARFRNESPAHVTHLLSGLIRRDLATVRGDQIDLTETGGRRAAELVRNYRLWEQFLSQEFQLPTDHGQAGAEELEHLLTAEQVEELERRLAASSHGSPDDSRAEGVRP